MQSAVNLILLSTILIQFIGRIHSLSSDGLFCQYKSMKRLFTPNKIITAVDAQECTLRCMFDGECERFNFDSSGSQQCELGHDHDILKCSSLVKKKSWVYYDRDCDIVSIFFHCK